MYGSGRVRAGSASAAVLAEESIYKLLPEDETGSRGTVRQRYRSKYPGKVDARSLTGTTFVVPKKPAAMLGPAAVERADPQSFVRKHQGEPRAPPAGKFAYADGSQRKPAVVKRDEKPVMGLSSNKNYITANAVDNILAVPRKPAETDENYARRPGFGKVPQYLDRVKREVAEELDYIRELQAAERGGNAPPGMRLLSDQEREDLLSGLRARQAEINKQYQTMSFTVDTVAKKRRKEQFERELADLERDIERLSKQFVYVQMDDGAAGTSVGGY